MPPLQEIDLGKKPLPDDDLGFKPLPGDEKKKKAPPKTDSFKEGMQRVRDLESQMNAPLVEFGKGAVRGAVSTVQALATPIRKAFGMPPARPPEEETTLSGKAGRLAESTAEFMLPEAGATKVVKALPRMGRVARAATKIGLTAAGGYGLAKAEGDTSPKTTAALLAIGPILEAGGPVTYRWLRRSAKQSLGKMFGSSALESKTVRQSIRDLVPTALDEGIPASWQKWALQTEKSSEAKGAAVKTIVEGPAGDVWVPISPVTNALDELINSAQVMMTQPIGKGQMALQGVMVKNDALLRQAKFFKAKLVNLPTKNGFVPARVLHDIKGSWNELAKFEGKTSEKTVRDLILSEKARAARSATNAIRDVLESSTPTIADVDKAYHISKDLHQYVVDTALESAGQVGKRVASGLAAQLRRTTATGIASGASLGAYSGYRKEGIPGAVGGAIVGGLTGRMLEHAFQSPAWKAKGPRIANALAEAIANGRADQVRRLLAPIIASTASGKP